MGSIVLVQDETGTFCRHINVVQYVVKVIFFMQFILLVEAVQSSSVVLTELLES